MVPTQATNQAPVPNASTNQVPVPNTSTNSSSFPIPFPATNPSSFQFPFPFPATNPATNPAANTVPNPSSFQFPFQFPNTVPNTVPNQPQNVTTETELIPLGPSLFSDILADKKEFSGTGFFKTDTGYYISSVFQANMMDYAGSQRILLSKTQHSYGPHFLRLLYKDRRLILEDTINPEFTNNYEMQVFDGIVSAETLPEKKQFNWFVGGDVIIVFSNNNILGYLNEDKGSLVISNTQSTKWSQIVETTKEPITNITKEDSVIPVSPKSPTTLTRLQNGAGYSVGCENQLKDSTPIKQDVELTLFQKSKKKVLNLVYNSETKKIHLKNNEKISLKVIESKNLNNPDKIVLSTGSTEWNYDGKYIIPRSNKLNYLTGFMVGNNLKLIFSEEPQGLYSEWTFY